MRIFFTLTSSWKLIEYFLRRKLNIEKLNPNLRCSEGWVSCPFSWSSLMWNGITQLHLHRRPIYFLFSLNVANNQPISLTFDELTRSMGFEVRGRQAHNGVLIVIMQRQVASWTLHLGHTIEGKGKCNRLLIIIVITFSFFFLFTSHLIREIGLERRRIEFGPIHFSISFAQQNLFDFFSRTT